MQKETSKRQASEVIWRYVNLKGRQYSRGEGQANYGQGKSNQLIKALDQQHDIQLEQKNIALFPMNSIDYLWLFFPIWRLQLIEQQISYANFLLVNVIMQIVMELISFILHHKSWITEKTK